MRATSVTIIGAGCAGLSLAAELSKIENSKVKLLGRPSPAETTPHVWGFWRMDWLEEPTHQSRSSWSKWEFLAPDSAVVRQESTTHSYHALLSTDWLGACRRKAQTTQFEQIDVDGPNLPADEDTEFVFDSRPPELDEPFMKQHFLGWEIKTKTPAFDPSVVRLMDFTTDQSRGIHFIYLLPFDAHTALVESTMFSFTTEPNSWYEDAITAYLSDQLGVTSFNVQRTEKGCIPMAFPDRPHSRYHAIGGNSGAVRASSGYAFTFIQKQVKQIARAIATRADTQSTIAVRRPHRTLDRMMDAVFLDVLASAPKRAPSLFMKLARALRGDELARFMSGTAGSAIIIKIIFAMPKGLFLYSAVRCCANAIKSCLAMPLKGQIK